MTSWQQCRGNSVWHFNSAPFIMHIYNNMIEIFVILSPYYKRCFKRQ